jgi:hypothetical protein
MDSEPSDSSLRGARFPRREPSSVLSLPALDRERLPASTGLETVHWSFKRQAHPTHWASVLGEPALSPPVFDTEPCTPSDPVWEGDGVVDPVDWDWMALRAYLNSSRTVLCVPNSKAHSAGGDCGSAGFRTLNLMQNGLTIPNPNPPPVVSHFFPQRRGVLRRSKSVTNRILSTNTV